MYNQLMDLQQQINSLRTQLNYVIRLDRPGAGGIVAVKYAEFTGTQATAVAASGTANVTNLAITHTLKKIGNRLILIAQIGQYANSAGGTQGGVLFAYNEGDIHVGDAVKGVEVGAAGNASANTIYNSRSHQLATIFAPNTLVEKTYRVQIRNYQHSARTIYINRSQRNEVLLDTYTSSSLILIEVSL